MRVWINERAAGGRALSWPALAVGAFSLISAHGQGAASQPVGLIQIPINAGANFISAPLHRIHTYRGVVSSVDSASLTVVGDPAWTVNQFAPLDGFTQFIALVRGSGLTPSHAGDWWPVLANDGNSLTLDTRDEDLPSALIAGDHIEIRHLTSLKDLFGTGATFVLNKDSNAIPGASQEDLIRFVQGTGFSSTIFYHDGSLIGEGYYVNGAGPLDGATVTLWPDQPIMVFRKSGSAPVTITCRGQVQTTRLAHYLQPGANVIGNPFAIDSPISGCGLLEAGWLGDDNGVPSASQEDLVRPVVGTGLGAPVYYHNGSSIAAGWYCNGALANDYPLEPARAYMLFIQGTDSFVWTQLPPYNL